MRKYVTYDKISAEELKVKRKTLGMMQKEFAEFIGVSKPTVELWEMSKKRLKAQLFYCCNYYRKNTLKVSKLPKKDYQFDFGICIAMKCVQ